MKRGALIRLRHLRFSEATSVRRPLSPLLRPWKCLPWRPKEIWLNYFRHLIANIKAKLWERERERERERVRNIHVKTDKNKNNYNNCDQSKRKLIKTLLHIQEQGNWYCSLTRSTNQYKKSYSKYTITVYSAVII